MRTTGKATDLITFSRSSGGTYLDSDGVLKTASADIPRIEYDANGNVLGLLVEESRVNLVTYSEDFTDSSWTKTGTATVADSSVTTPDGQQNGFLLEAIGTDRIEETPSTTITGAATVSVFAKYDNVPYIQITILDPSANGQRQWFKIQDGTLGSSAAVGTGKNLVGASITDMGNGFYRVSLSVDGFSGQTARCLIYLARTDSSFDSASGDSAVIYGAQLEAGAFPTSYIPTSGSTATRAADVASIATSEFGYRDDEGTFVCEFDVTDPSFTNANYVFTAGGSARFYYNNAGTGAWSTFDGSLGISGNGPSQDGTLAKVAVGMGSTGSIHFVDGVQQASGGSKPQGNAGPSLFLGGESDSQRLNGHIKKLTYIPRRLTNDQLQEITS